MQQKNHLVQFQRWWYCVRDVAAGYVIHVHCPSIVIVMHNLNSDLVHIICTH